jgi:hypothetical protein
MATCRPLATSTRVSPALVRQEAGSRPQVYLPPVRPVAPISLDCQCQSLLQSPTCKPRASRRTPLSLRPRKIPVASTSALRAPVRLPVRSTLRRTWRHMTRTGPSPTCAHTRRAPGPSHASTILGVTSCRSTGTSTVWPMPPRASQLDLLRALSLALLLVRCAPSEVSVSTRTFADGVMLVERATLDTSVPAPAMSSRRSRWKTVT